MKEKKQAPPPLDPPRTLPAPSIIFFSLGGLHTRNSLGKKGGARAEIREAARTTTLWRVGRRGSFSIRNNPIALNSLFRTLPPAFKGQHALASGDSGPTTGHQNEVSAKVAVGYELRVGGISRRNRGGGKGGVDRSINRSRRSSSPLRLSGKHSNRGGGGQE